MKLLKIRNTIVFSYFNIFWFLSIISLVWVIVDRVALDWTEGDSFLRRPGRNTLPYSSWDGPMTTITGWIWMITARTLLVSLNMSFFTVMWMIPNFMEEAAPKFLDMDIRHSNLAIHKFTGIWLNGVPTMLHVIVLFLPWADGNSVTFFYDGFDFSNWWDPCVKPFSAFSHEDGANYTWDEIFRLVLIIIVFCIMMPISRADWMLGKSYSTAMIIHSVAGLAFMVDLVRKNTHQLSWRFNLPLIILYVIDRLFATFLYRVNKFKVHKIRPCSETSFLVFGKLDNVPRTGQGCGDNYWLLHRFSKTTPCKPIFQRAHPYTAFQNWDRSTDHIWNVGFIINCNPENKHSWSSWLKGNEKASSDRIVQSNLRGLDNPKFKDDNGIERTHWKNKVTPDNEVQKVERLDPEDLHFYVRSWGPYRSSFYAVDIFDTYDELFLIAAGSGFGFILSAITLLAENHRLGDNIEYGKSKNVTVLFSARQTEVVDIFTELVIQVPGYEHCKFHIRFTGKKKEITKNEDEKPVSSSTQSVDSESKLLGLKYLGNFEKSKLTLASERLNFEQILGQSDRIQTTLACVCGSQSFIKGVKKQCSKIGMRLRVEEI